MVRRDEDGPPFDCQRALAEHFRSTGTGPTPEEQEFLENDFDDNWDEDWPDEPDEYLDALDDMPGTAREVNEWLGKQPKRRGRQPRIALDIEDEEPTEEAFDGP